MSGRHRKPSLIARLLGDSEALVEPADEVGDEVVASSESDPRVLLLCKDTEHRRWGGRWLSRYSLALTVADDASTMLAEIGAGGFDVVVVEAGLRDAANEPAAVTVSEAAGADVIVMVLCASNREFERMRLLPDVDVLGKPLNWEMISRRVALVARHAATRRELTRTQQELEAVNTHLERFRREVDSREAYEPITGLPNRRKFKDLVARGMQTVARDGSSLAVIVIGFARFRLIVEAMGQSQADRILAGISDKLSQCLSTVYADAGIIGGLRTAVVGNLEQHRFGVMLTWSGDAEEMDRLRAQIADTLSLPIQIAGQTVYLSACLGIVRYPQDAENVDSLLQRAENAMREAQRRGGGFHYHCRHSDAAAAMKLRIEHRLHEAIDNGDLTLAYQPLVTATGVQLQGAEALLRWSESAELGVTPSEFVMIAEESGLMLRLGQFVLDAACRQLAAWRAAGLDVPRVCINVAKAQLMSGDFVELVTRCLARYELPPSTVELELSERGVLSGEQGVVAQLGALKQLGVRLSIDDFGTGESAIGYLKDMPVDTLKIDKSYIDGMMDNPKDAALTSAMVALGQRLQLEVIAEGVELESQRAALADMGCDTLQGFLFARPMTPEKLFELFGPSAAIVENEAI